MLNSDTWRVYVFIAMDLFYNMDENGIYIKWIALCQFLLDRDSFVIRLDESVIQTP